MCRGGDLRDLDPETPQHSVATRRIRISFFISTQTLCQTDNQSRLLKTNLQPLHPCLQPKLEKLLWKGGTRFLQALTT